MEPVAQDRLLILDDADSIEMGAGRRLEILHTPGHAKHHIVFLDSLTGGLFVGDSVGIAFPHGHITQPVTPPPDFDPSLVIEQLRRMAALEPAFLGFAHFGIDRSPQERLAEAEDRLGEWVSRVEALPDDDSAVSEFRDWVLDGYRTEGFNEDVIEVYDRNTYWPMQVAGIRRWLSKR